MRTGWAVLHCGRWLWARVHGTARDDFPSSQEIGTAERSNGEGERDGLADGIPHTTRYEFRRRCLRTSLGQRVRVGGEWSAGESDYLMYFSFNSGNLRSLPLRFHQMWKSGDFGKSI